jgi:hypothetical protein
MHKSEFLIHSQENHNVTQHEKRVKKVEKVTRNTNRSNVTRFLIENAVKFAFLLFFFGLIILLEIASAQKKVEIFLTYELRHEEKNWSGKIFREKFQAMKII